MALETLQDPTASFLNFRIKTNDELQTLIAACRERSARRKAQPDSLPPLSTDQVVVQELLTAKTPITLTVPLAMVGAVLVEPLTDYRDETLCHLASDNDGCGKFSNHEYYDGNNARRIELGEVAGTMTTDISALVSSLPTAS